MVSNNYPVRFLVPRTRGRIGDARLEAAVGLRRLRQKGVPISRTLIQRVRGKYPNKDFVVTSSEVFQEQFDMRMARKALFNRSRRRILFALADRLPAKISQKLRTHTAAGSAALLHLLEFVQEGQHPLMVQLRKRYKYFYMRGNNLVFTDNPKGFSPYYDKKWETKTPR